MTKKRIISGLVLIIVMFLPVMISAQTRYIFTTFKGDADADQKLWVYTSTDGTNFYHLYDGYGGPTGCVRDPSIIKHTDGYYYVAHTVYSWTTESSYFAIARSSNLTSWSHHVSINSGISNVRNVWAPEFYVEGSTVRIIVSMRSQTSEFRPYIFTATDSSLTSWSGPVDMGIGENHIDTFLVKSGSTYHAFLKDESSKYIEHCTSSGITGPWNWVGTGNWSGWGSGYEGPCLFQLDNGNWRMYLDNYSSGSGLFATTSSDLSSWSGLSGISVDTSGVVRHGTVYKEITGATPTPVGTLGDVNDNGVVDIVDALLVAQYYVGLNPANFNQNNADTNCNNTVDIVDALLIAQYYVGLISSFC